MWFSRSDERAMDALCDSSNGNDGYSRDLHLKLLHLARPGERLSVLCLGAHSDDIEIGAGGKLLAWIPQEVGRDVSWCVLGAEGEREYEAGASANDFLQGAAISKVEMLPFRNSFFPMHGREIKDWFEGLKARVTPDVILTHRRDDAHQDHREI